MQRFIEVNQHYLLYNAKHINLSNGAHNYYNRANGFFWKPFLISWTIRLLGLVDFIMILIYLIFSHRD